MLNCRFEMLFLLGSVTLCLGCGRERVAGPEPDMAAVRELREALGKESSSSEKVEQKAVGTGWASLKGQFVFTGAVGAPKALVVDKDLAVCSKDGMKLFEQSLVVDESSKGLANVVIFLRKSSRVKNKKAAEKLVFDQKNCEFMTPVFAARVGQDVDVKNSDPIGHNTNISGSSFNQLIPSGDSTVFTPGRETGLPVSVTCNIHPWMKAYAVFREDGYVAVSSSTGTFEIPDLPAGEPLEFQVWHERSTGRSGALSLDQPKLQWNSKGRFKITLKENEDRDLGTLEIPADSISG